MYGVWSPYFRQMRRKSWVIRLLLILSVINVLKLNKTMKMDKGWSFAWPGSKTLVEKNYYYKIAAIV